jgi:putative FmdB family regulatory protein
MPLYDYSCEQCGSFEAKREAAEAGTPAACPECGAPSQRLWSVPKVAFNGNPHTFHPRKPRWKLASLQAGQGAAAAAGGSATATAGTLADEEPAPEADAPAADA